MIVLAFERLPAGSLGCYGSFAVATPSFDLLAAQGLTFDNTYVDEHGLNWPLDDSHTLHLNCTDEQSIDGSARDFRQRLRQQERIVWCRVDSRTDRDAWSSDPLSAHFEYVARADQLVQRLLEIIVAADDSRDIVVTANKGDPAAIRRERPAWVQSLCEEVTHIPLAIALHDGPVGRCPELAGPVQLAELLQCLAMSGDAEATVTEWRERLANNDTIKLGSTQASAVRTPDWFSIRPVNSSENPSASSSVQLFHQPADRWLLLDQARQYPEVVDRLI